jgi:putative oxidoreductase
MSKSMNFAYWFARIVAALILLQTLYFKFSASEESVYIFSTVGMEPFGRISVGILELVSGMLLLFNRTAWFGAGLAAGLMAGAVAMHLTVLGISVKDDGGYLFVLALVVMLLSMFVLFINRHKIEALVRGLRKTT